MINKQGSYGILDSFFFPSGTSFTKMLLIDEQFSPMFSIR